VRSALSGAAIAPCTCRSTIRPDANSPPTRRPPRFGTVTYTFTPATIAAGGNQVEFPTGTIQTVDVMIDVQGTADLSQITVNGTTQVPVPTVNGPTAKSQCKHGGWKTFTSPSFRNQGQCVSWYEHHRTASTGR